MVELPTGYTVIKDERSGDVTFLDENGLPIMTHPYDNDAIRWLVIINYIRKMKLSEKKIQVS